jgi:hypothetical protein
MNRLACLRRDEALYRLVRLPGRDGGRVLIALKIAHPSRLGSRHGVFTRRTGSRSIAARSA